MISLLPKVDAMIINNRCGCGFFYPAKPPREWTKEERQSVADHQEIHLREQRLADEALDKAAER